QEPADPVIGVAEDLAGRRGVIVAGPGSGNGEWVDDLAQALGWPVLAAPQAPVWGRSDAVVDGADALLRIADLHDGLRPEVIVHLGLPLASRVVGEWLAATGATYIVAAGPGRWIDPHGTAAVVLPFDAGSLLAAWRRQLDAVESVDAG